MYFDVSLVTDRPCENTCHRKGLHGTYLSIRYVGLLWALLTVQTILTVGLGPEVSHPVSNCESQRLPFPGFMIRVEMQTFRRGP